MRAWYASGGWRWRLARAAARRAALAAADERGQGTVEYALLLATFLTTVVAMGAIWHAARDGVLLGCATRASSHSMEEVDVGALQDVLAY